MAGFIGGYVAPSLVIVAAPIIVQYLIAICREEDLQGFSVLMLVGDPFAWLQVIIWLITTSSILMIPFDKYRGRPSPGHSGQPTEYTDNCGGAYMTETGAFLAFHSLFIHQSLYVYRNFPYVMGAMFVFTLALSIHLYVQAKKPKPGENEKAKSSSSSGPMLYELCHGVDYHPRLLDYFDIKQWTTVRTGFLSWQVLAIVFFYAGYLLQGFNWGHFVTTLLLTYYVVKSAVCERRYLATLDADGVKPGFYLLWITMNLDPVVNTFSSHYFVTHQPDLGFLFNLAIFGLGFLVIYTKFAIEAQKELFKMSRGNCQIWGRKATYVEVVGGQLDKDQPRSRLLTSGYWGMARHLHYVFDILSSVCWALPGIGHGIWPFLPCFYMTATVFYRMFRDEAKCSAKYGPLWDQYCTTVKYRLIPYIF